MVGLFLTNYCFLCYNNVSLIKENIMKKTFSIIGTILLLIIIAFAFGVNASMHGYQVTISSFLIGTSSGLAPDFSYNITAFDRVLSVIYMIAWFYMAFRSGKRGTNTVFSAMMIYSLLPFIGFIGYFFIESSKFGITFLLSLIWGYPYFPIIINQSSVSA